MNIIFQMSKFITTSILILTVSSIVLFASAQNIVDFTYSEYDHRSGKSNRHKQTIDIKPSKEIIQGYSFPDACYLARKLEEQKIEDSKEVANYDIDSMIDSLKGNFIEMLKVSEKIKKKKNNIQELSLISGRYSNVTVVSPKDLQSLKVAENRLQEINNEIQARSEELEQLVKDSMRNSGGNEFAISSVNFEIQSLRLKLEYLRSLKRNSNDAEATKIKDQYQKYFSDLKTRFDKQNGLIDDLNTILKNFNEIGALRAKILSLKGKIEISNLMIEEKEACVKEREEIRKVQKYDEEIKSHMANLREKKKEKSNINNKYCEGVANKLQDRVKNVLLSYDYTFECAKGLDTVKDERNRQIIEKEKADARLSELENSAGIDDYKKKFEQNRQYIKIKQEELTKFTMPQYHHDVNELSRLISKTENDLQDATQRKKDLGNPSSTKDVDYGKIQELVSKIKKLKGTYCQEYESYDNRAQKIWKIVQKYEAEIEYSSKIRSIYEEEINELRLLQTEFNSLRSRILSQIAPN